MGRYAVDEAADGAYQIVNLRSELINSFVHPIRSVGLALLNAEKPGEIVGLNLLHLYHRLQRFFHLFEA
jgi:hypothetical protein